MGIFETIVDVHFGGLAIEVQNGGGYVERGTGTRNFSKAVVSLWFRVPQESINAIWAAAPSPRLGLGGTLIPFVIFGASYTGYQIDSVANTPQDYTYATYNDATLLSSETRQWGTGPLYSEGDAVQFGPSFIGMQVDIDADDNLIQYLYVRLQGNMYGTGTWALPVPIRSSSDAAVQANQSVHVWDTDQAWSYSFEFCQTQYVIVDGTHTTTTVYSDQSDIQTRAKGPDAFNIVSTQMRIRPDHWHHVIVSFDIGHRMTAVGAYYVYDQPNCDSVVNAELIESSVGNDVATPGKCWISLDDVNRTGEGLQQWRFNRPPSLGDNGIISENLYFTATHDIAVVLSQKSWETAGLAGVQVEGEAGLPTYALPATQITSSEKAFALPATTEFADRIFKIELAEFQMFTGVTMNTASKANRRVFVSDAGKPVNPTVAKKFFKKSPDILLHADTDWIKGKNTGTAGNFEPTMPIKKYRPDPSLRGPQG